MTWFANEILAPAVPGLVDEFGAFAGYREAVHVIRSLDSYRFHDDTVRHGLPPEGLLVVRPVGEPSELQDWYDEQVIPWLAPPGWALRELALSPAQVSQVASGVEQLPPETFLQALKHLASTHGTTVAYAYFSTWGGTNELEYAWVFGSIETVLINTSRDDTHLLLSEGVRPREVDRNLLEALFSSLGVELPTSFFAPHTRRFPWNDYLIVPARDRATSRP